MSPMEIKVYTLADCPHCAEMKAWLRERGCEFEELDIKADVENLREWREVSGGVGVPVITHGRDVMIGFDGHRLEGFISSCENTTPVKED